MRERHDVRKDAISSDSDTIDPPISEGAHMANGHG